MSDFRKSCWGFFAGAGLFAASSNHKWAAIRPDFDNPMGMILVGLVTGSLAVIMFGDRK